MPGALKDITRKVNRPLSVVCVIAETCAGPKRMTVVILDLSGFEIVTVENQALLTSAAKHINSFLAHQSVRPHFDAAIGVVPKIMHSWNLDLDCVLPDRQLQHCLVGLVIANKSTIHENAGITEAALHPMKSCEANCQGSRSRTICRLLIDTGAPAKQGGAQWNYQCDEAFHGCL